MKYMMIHAVDQDATPSDPTCAHTRGARRLGARRCSARGVLLDGARLRPVSDATTVRAPGGSPVVTDGPFAETKEQVAGYDVIDCPDLDAAVAVAAAHPTTHVGSDRGARVRRGHARPRGAGAGARRQAALPDAGLRRHAQRSMAAAADAADEAAARPADDVDDGPDEVDALDRRRRPRAVCTAGRWSSRTRP